MLRIVVFFLFLSLSQRASGQTVADFTLEDMYGEEQSYSDLKGEKLTVIDFWATWCAPCLKAIPKLASIADKYRDRGLGVVGVNVDGPRNLSKVRPLATSKGVNYPVVLDVNSELMSELNVDKIPTLLIVNAADEIIALFEGYSQADAGKIDEEIDRLLRL